MRYKTLTDTLRDAMNQSGLSQYRIAKDTGLEVASVRRFMRGMQGLRLDKADILAQYFKLELKERR